MLLFISLLLNAILGYLLFVSTKKGMSYRKSFEQAKQHGAYVRQRYFQALDKEVMLKHNFFDMKQYIEKLELLANEHLQNVVIKERRTTA